MLWCGIALCTGLAGSQAIGSEAAMATETDRPAHTVTGTLDMLDVSTGKGMLKNELGKPIFFEIAKPELFGHLSVGERVTVQLDHEGRAIKVIGIPAPELPDPPPQSAK